MNDDRHIVTLTVQQLKDAILTSVKEEIQKLLIQSTKDSEDNLDDLLLTRHQVAKMFGISTVSLDKWKSAGLLPKHIKMAGRVYYMRQEILEMINKRKSK